MSNKTNKFRRAIHHLKSDQIDDRMSVLEAAPTNSTQNLMTVEPSVQVASTEETVSLGLDFDKGNEDDDGKDTSGIIAADGTILTLEPDVGDTSYILGPMASMWYAWGNFTRIGYIQEDTRKMVNLGSITGQLGSWDDEETFTSYGQLTFEQAIWFRDIGKKDGAGNDTPNYRAFYPGPPSSTADGFGRYLAVIVGEGKTQTTGNPRSTSDPKNAPEDATTQFSALLNQLQSALPKSLRSAIDNIQNVLSDLGDFATGVNDGLTTMYDVVEVIEDARENGNIKNGEIVNGALGSFENPMQNSVSDKTAEQILKGVDVGSEWMGGQIQNNTSVAPGVMGGEGTMGAKGIHNNLPGMGLNDDQYPSPYNSDGGVVIPDTFAFRPHGFEDQAIVKVWGKISEMFFGGNKIEAEKDMATMLDQSVGAFLPKTPGRKDPVVHFETVIPQEQVERVTGKQSSTPSKSDETQLASIQRPPSYVRDSIRRQMSGKDYSIEDKLNIINWQQKIKAEFPNEPVPDMVFNPGDKVAWGKKNTGPATTKNRGGANAASMLINFGGDTSDFIKKYGVTPEEYMKLPQQGYNQSSKKKSKIQVAHYKPQGKLLSEERIWLREIKKPVKVPELQKKFKGIKPRVKKKGDYKIVGGGLMKDNIAPPEFSPTRENRLWRKYEVNQNRRASQEKKNQVLELIGEGDHQWNHMLGNEKWRSASQMKKFYGDHDYLYDYYYGGKKHKVLRKEGLEKDFLLFIEDENGFKDTLLQSELNELLAEERDKEDFKEYYMKETEQKEREKNFDRATRLKSIVGRIKRDDIKPEYPKEAPPKMVNGYHPKFGKKYKHDKLDPISARSMPPTGDPEIDANVEKARKKPK